MNTTNTKALNTIRTLCHATARNDTPAAQIAYGHLLALCEHNKADFSATLRDGARLLLRSACGVRDSAAYMHFTGGGA